MIAIPYLVLLLVPRGALGTSVKMDFLPLGDVRTDPIINPDCLSDHVHTFYGASVMRPETTYDDLRNAYGNSGNVEENKSLYWHPTVYNYDHSDGTFKKDEIWFASAYYIWTTGQATAFPDGFKMIAGFGDDNTRADAECVNESECEKEDCSTNNDFFPTSACEELEVSMAFPTCWDGVNIDSDDHRSHVSYGEGYFDGDCPDTHPVKLPEIQLFFRIAPYDGGHHQFSDGTGNFHADYFSGWKQEELQRVLDECENYSEAASPDAWCEDFLTFRDAPKSFGCGEDDDIVAGLDPLQPNPALDATLITDEVIDNVAELPRVACSGELKPDDGSKSMSKSPKLPAAHRLRKEKPLKHEITKLVNVVVKHGLS